MKKLVLLLFIGMITLSVSAQDKVAKIEFKATKIDYGEITKGSNGVRTFEFTNTGTAPLIISKVNSSCGCTIPEKPVDPILPGEKGEIKVKYDTKRIGRFIKTITVASNAANDDDGIVALSINGVVLDTDQNGSTLIKDKPTVAK